ncbi:MAG: response regulator [Gemmatimonadales bacterium]|nr:response regulator [Gemmatimonadales bacterium]
MPSMPPRTILVVDDEEIVRALVARALRSAGYRVEEATDGRAGLALLESGSVSFDLVVCDLVMPALNGRDLARWITRHRPGLPVLFISGYPLPYLQAHDLHDPTFPLLRKPFLPSRLLESVEEALAAPGGRKDQISQFDMTIPSDPSDELRRG